MRKAERGNQLRLLNIWQRLIGGSMANLAACERSAPLTKTFSFLISDCLAVYQHSHPLASPYLPRFQPLPTISYADCNTSLQMQVTMCILSCFDKCQIKNTPNSVFEVSRYLCCG